MATAPAIPVSKARYPATTVVAWLLIIFIVLFPKGGIKALGVPLTFGYAILSLTFPVLAFIRLTAFPLRVGKLNLLAIASLLPFQGVLLYSLFANGSDSLGGLLSDITVFFLCPAAFLFVYPIFLPRIDPVWLSRWLRFSILAAAIFGIVLFFSYPFTGHLFQIPYLTINADDAGLIESTKHIQRGYFLKLISTYNNGNLYGVCTLMLLPLYNRLEQRGWARIILKLALVLTLARTVWVGLVLEQLLSLLRVGAGAVRTFPYFQAGPTVKRAFFIGITVVAILLGLALTSGNLAFLFDRGLGGRVIIFSNLTHPTLLPNEPVGFFYEIVYASALYSYGIVGLLGILLLFLFPIVLFLADPTIRRSPIRFAAFKGLVLYILLAGIDGALNLIPVMAIYWFIYMIFLEGWPGVRRLAPQLHPHSVVGETSPATALLN